jgi:Phospholipase_D-nuclease N-terminal
MTRTRWSELGGTARGAIIILGAVQLGLQVAALRDLHRRSDRQVRGRRPVWVAVSFVNFVGPVVYFLAGRRTL